MPGLLAKSGLHSTLTELVEQISPEKIKVELDFLVSSVLKPEAELNIYRIIQESVNNILKHSGADKAKILIKRKNQNLFLEISDNGSGFNANKLSSLSGNGLNNIYSRIDFMKGKINISSNPTDGTCFTIQLPLTQITNG